MKIFNNIKTIIPNNLIIGIARFFSEKIQSYCLLSDILQHDLIEDGLITERCSGWLDKDSNDIIYENDVVKRGNVLYVVKFDPFSHHFYLGTNIRFNKKSNKYDSYVITEIKEEVNKGYSTNSYLTESSAAKMKKICSARFFNQESLDLARSLR